MADTPSQNFGPLPDTLTFGPFGPDGDIIVHIENLVLGCPPFVQNIGVPFVCGEGTISVVATDSWYPVVFTDTEYYSVRKDGNSPTTYPSGTSPHDLTDGSFCVYPSNSGGLQTGHITGYDLSGNGTDPVTSIEVDVSRLSGLIYIASVGFSTNTTIVFSGIENVIDIYAYDLPNITALDISLSVSANFIIVKNNPLQTDLTFSSLSQCFHFDGRGCAFTQSVIDAILIEIAANGWAATVELSGGTNAAPSATGLSAKSTIEGNGGTVSVNP